MPHRHLWRLAAYILLSLPDCDGYADRAVTFRCGLCGKEEGWSATFKMGAPLGMPELIAQARAQENKASTPWSRMARQQEQVKAHW
jgi:hypothetical protein